MNLSDWIQLGIFATQAMLLIIGSTIAFLQYQRVIVNIEDRQKELDNAKERFEEEVHKAELRTHDQARTIVSFLTALILINGFLLFIYGKVKDKA